MKLHNALGVGAGFFVVAAVFTNDWARLLALVIYAAAIGAMLAYPGWRAERAERRRLAAAAEAEHAALMRGDIHACNAPCAGAPNHYGPCCCDYGHMWHDPVHGGRVPDLVTGVSA